MTPVSDSPLADSLASIQPPQLQIRIGALNLGPLFLQLTHKKKLGWSPDKAKKAVEDYKEFLYISYLYRDKINYTIVPSEEVDEVWHAHIMDTRKYYADCMSTFGEVLHHSPYLGLDEETGEEELLEAVHQTRTAYKIELDKDLPHNFEASFCNVD
ncbi:MAG: glycine-rich domain-containing protein-like [Bacteroidota bacterium]